MADQAGKSGEQQEAEADVEGFREDLGPFVVAAETTRMPMVFSNARVPDNPIIFVNQAFLNLTGHEEHEVLGQNFDFLIQPATDPEALVELQTAFEGGRGLETQVYLHRRDGSPIWVTILISPVRDGTGAVVQHFASFVDMTKHEQERERLRFLLDELNRRTQDTLATVLAIAGQTLQGTADEPTLDAYEGRILALSKAHTLLGAANWDKVGLRVILDQTLETPGRRARFSVEGDEVFFRSKEALSLAMVFHELATNAVAHGALSAGSGGRVDVAWRREAGPKGERVRLLWRESGGPPVAQPSFMGFGRRMLDGGGAYDLNGEVHLTFAAEGVSCEIVMPAFEGPRG